MREIMESFLDQIVARGPELLAAVAVLVVGWLVALACALLVRVLLKKTDIDNKIAAISIQQGA